MIASTPLQRLKPAGVLTQPPRMHRPSTKYNILLMDHDKQELDIFSGFLKDTYEIFIARNESSLVKIMKTQPVHLVISDMELNGIGGSRLCRQLKSSADYAHIPVVLLIKGNSPHFRLKSLESGADAYIEKPFSPEHIKAQIRNLMTNRAKIKDYYAHSLFAPVTTTGSKTNEVFLNRLNDLISDNLRNLDLDIDLLARLMNISRPTLYRKVKCISDLTPNELINMARLNEAVKLISTGDYKIFEVAKMAGFNSRSNFGKAFFKYFNVTPTAYRKRQKTL